MSDLTCYLCKHSVASHDRGMYDACRECGCGSFHDEVTGKRHLAIKARERVIDAARAFAKHPRRDSVGQPLIEELVEAVKELEDREV